MMTSYIRLSIRITQLNSSPSDLSSKACVMYSIYVQDNDIIDLKVVDPSKAFVVVRCSLIVFIDRLLSLLAEPRTTQSS